MPWTLHPYSSVEEAVLPYIDMTDTVGIEEGNRVIERTQLVMSKVCRPDMNLQRVSLQCGMLTTSFAQETFLLFLP